MLSLFMKTLPKMLQTSNQTKTAELHQTPFCLSEISAEPALIKSQLQTYCEKDSFKSSQKLLHMNFFLSYNYIHELWDIIKLTVLQKTIMTSIIQPSSSRSFHPSAWSCYLSLNICYEHWILNYYLISIKGNILEQIT